MGARYGILGLWERVDDVLKRSGNWFRLSVGLIYKWYGVCRFRVFVTFSGALEHCMRGLVAQSFFFLISVSPSFLVHVFFQV